MIWQLSDLVDLKLLVFVALIFIPLERLVPHCKEQKTLRKHWLNDAFYMLFNGILIKAGLLLVVTIALLAIGILIPDRAGELVRSQPIWLQAIEVIVIADVGFYLAHRAFHQVPFLWRFHAVHHSIEEMDWLAAHRVHPVDQVLTKSASYVPIFALGFAPAAIGIYVAIYQWQSLLIHSNVKLNFGPLKWILASPQFHHWHHANEPQAYDKNFSGQLPFLDAIGGTLYMPDRMPSTYGTNDPVPGVYHEQLAYPFVAAKPRPGSSLAPTAGDNQR